MRIAVLTSSFPAHSGDAAAAAGLFVKDFCVALRDLGMDVVVVTPDKKGDAKEKIEGVEVCWFPWAGGTKPLSVLKPYKPLDALAMTTLFRSGRRVLDALMEEKRFDHVLAMWATPAGVLARGLKRREGIPYTTWCLGSDIWNYGRYPIFKRIIRNVILRSDLVYADGFDLCAAVENLSGRACEFLPTSRKLDQSLAYDVSGEADGTRFLFVARYHRVKGVDVLLEAMARYLARGHRGALQLFGGGPMEEYIRQRAGESDLGDRVNVGGFADESTLISQMKACDVFVIPSRMESIPISLSDAAQLGRRVIVTQVGDMGRLVQETGAGISVPPDDPEALCEAMIAMSERSPQEFSDGVVKLASQFDVDKTAAKWLKAVAGLRTSEKE